MEYREMLHRYVGRRVCVSTFGHSKLWGDLAAVNDDCVRLVNTTLATDGDDQWLAQSAYADPESNYGLRHAETIVHFHHIVAITCVDSDLPAFVSNDAAETQRQSEILGQRGPADDVFQHLRLERLEVLVGPALVRLADSQDAVGLPERILSLRNAVGAQLGFLLPSVRLRDDMRLGENEYRIFVNGCEVGRGEARPDRLLAIAPPDSDVELAGDSSQHGDFCPPGVWIPPDDREAVEGAGCFVIEPASLIAMHLQAEVKRNAHDLFTLEGLRMLLEHLRQTSPTVVEELVPTRMPLARLHDLLGRLLEEGVPLRPLERILERVAHLPPNIDDVDQMLSSLRASLGRLLCDRFRDGDGQLQLVTLDHQLSSRLDEVLLGPMEEGGGMWLATFVRGLSEWCARERLAKRDLPLVVSALVRRRLFQLLNNHVPGVTVLAFSEIPADVPVDLGATVGADELGLGQPASKRRKTSRSRTEPALSGPPRRQAPR
jgi:flagellar biosynthesis protein FlhA